MGHQVLEQLYPRVGFSDNKLKNIYNQKATDSSVLLSAVGLWLIHNDKKSSEDVVVLISTEYRNLLLSLLNSFLSTFWFTGGSKDYDLYLWELQNHIFVLQVWSPISCFFSVS